MRRYPWEILGTVVAIGVIYGVAGLLDWADDAGLFPHVTDDEFYALIGAGIVLAWSHAFVWDRTRRHARAEGQRLAAMRILAVFNLLRSEDHNPEKPPTVDEAIQRARRRDTTT